MEISIEEDERSAERLAELAGIASAQGDQRGARFYDRMSRARTLRVKLRREGEATGEIERRIGEFLRADESR